MLAYLEDPSAARREGGYCRFDAHIELGGVLDAIAEEFEDRTDLTEIIDSASRCLETTRILDVAPWARGRWEDERMRIWEPMPEKLLDFGQLDSD